MPSGVNAAPRGPEPTVIAVPAVLVATVIGVTLFDPELATYALWVAMVTFQTLTLVAVVELPTLSATTYWYM